MPCRIRKEVRLEPPQELELDENENYLPHPYFQKKSKISGEGVICAPSPKHGIVPKKYNQLFLLSSQ